MGNTRLRADIRCYVKPEVQAVWKRKAEHWGMSINQYTKAIVLEQCLQLPRGFWQYPMEERNQWLRGV